jgi:RNA polymerase sigma-70 factor (ECF subfamily)
MPDTPADVIPAALGPNAIDWAHLLARAQDGDGVAYARFMRSVALYIRHIGHSIGLASPELERGVRDVLLTIHDVRHTYDPSRPVMPWLLAIIRHRLIDPACRENRMPFP